MDIAWSLLKAFLVGGGICIVGQLLIDLTKMTPGKVLVSFVVLGVILGAVGVYGPFAEWAGSGANVPLVGFGNALAAGTKQAVAEKGLIGALSGPLTSSAVGIMAAILSGLAVSLVAKPKDK